MVLYIIYMSKVVVIRSKSGWKYPFDKKQYRNLLETGLTLLTGTGTVKDAVGRLISQGKIGIKANCLARRLNATPPALGEALVEVLSDTGREPNDLIIWDRTNRELEQAGYRLNASSFGYRCLGTDTNGVNYSDDFYSSGEVNSLVSRIMTEMIDHSINLPILKDHSIAGLSGCLKNMYGAVHNPNKYHDDNCNPYAAQVNDLEPIKGKHRLAIIDATRVQYQGGPGFNSAYLATYGGLILAIDPVAADRIGLEMVEYCRSQKGLPPLEKAGRPVKYLKTAQELGLGTADRAEIELEVYRLDGSGKPVETGLTG